MSDPCPQPGLADRDRGSVMEEVQLKAARIYNRALRECTTEYLWVVEDDVILPPDAAERLLRPMRADAASVSARVDSRLHPGPIAWDRNLKTMTPGQGVQEICGNGFGCVILRRSVLRHHGLTHRGLRGNFDQELYRQLAGTPFRALIDWDVHCEHLDAPRMGLPARFVIITPGRCGSQLLSEALDAHFAVKCWHEVLNPVVSIPGRTEEMVGHDLMELNVAVPCDHRPLCPVAKMR